MCARACVERWRMHCIVGRTRNVDRTVGVIVGTRDGRVVGRMVGVGVGRCVGRTVGACGYDTAQRVATKHTSLATQPSGRARSRRRCGRVSRPVRCSCGRASGNADGLDAATVGGGGRTRSTACGTARQRMGTITLRPLALQYTAHDAPATSPKTWPHLPRTFLRSTSVP